ncbi:hypothetical protein C8Q77DRAFT_572250 [Trametes polyzona]|nr:hypothetical protein C8Q77DRAFT_572250 [Trametes polyzona]
MENCRPSTLQHPPGITYPPRSLNADRTNDGRDSMVSLPETEYSYVPMERWIGTHQREAQRHRFRTRVMSIGVTLAFMSCRILLGSIACLTGMILCLSVGITFAEVLVETDPERAAVWFQWPGTRLALPYGIMAFGVPIALLEGIWRKWRYIDLSLRDWVPLGALCALEVATCPLALIVGMAIAQERFPLPHGVFARIILLDVVLGYMFGTPILIVVIAIVKYRL